MNKKIAVFISFSLHFIILLAGIKLFVTLSPDEQKEGILPHVIQSNVIASYHEEVPRSQKIAIFPRNTSAASAASLPMSEFKQGKNEPVPELLQRLHSAIQTQQRYPQDAVEMERAGTTRLAFTLFANGQIKNLRIVKSSGTNTLDQAAITAINHATPFQHVAKLVSRPTDYQIDVVFALA